MPVHWISCADELPPEDEKVYGWCAESDFYSGGAVQMRRRGGTWDDFASFERFDNQDPNVFVTHWTRSLGPPPGCPTKNEMSMRLKEDACQHGIDFANPCAACDMDHTVRSILARDRRH